MRRHGAETLAWKVADHSNAQALARLALARLAAAQEELDLVNAEGLLQQAADHGSTLALGCLAEMRARAGDWEGAEAVARRAADHGDVMMVRHPSKQGMRSKFWPYGLNADGTPTPPW
ncbi:hypothetical protein ACIQF5_04670 [Streptomyces goshikiensis]|uniref:hypothetical protein n=1 Tax=Streptomyces goshikiensis TaxID=1942 RepID=UPI0038213F18